MMSFTGAEMRPLHPDWKSAERQGAVIGYGIFLLILAAIALLPGWLGWFEMPWWLKTGLIGLGVLLFVFYVIVAPTVRYNRFRFAVSDEELEIHNGLFFISETLVPMSKVQHVELEIGPILRRYHLAEVHIVTAATTHTIGGVKLEEAEQLKQRIGRLARRIDE